MKADLIERLREAAGRTKSADHYVLLHEAANALLTHLDPKRIGIAAYEHNISGSLENLKRFVTDILGE